MWRGRVLSISDASLRVVWLEGSYTGRWKVARTQDPANKKKRIDWVDLIPKDSVLLYDFQLTFTGHLRKKTIDHLKQVYASLDQPNT